MTDWRSPSGNILFIRSRLYTFSTSTIASSTNDPIAMHIPPRLIVFIVKPMRCKATMAASSERGMVTSEISVVRTFMRNKNRIATTSTPPSINAFFTLSILLSMKCD